MDKYLTVVLIFMIVGVPISFIDPSNGEMRDRPWIEFFYLSIAGIIIIFFYSSYKDKKERQKANAKRKKSKK